jgi:hypothetical protein
MGVSLNLKKIALHCSEHFFDHSKARFTANEKLTFGARTFHLQPFRFAKNGYRKNLNSHSELFFSSLVGFVEEIHLERR